MAQFNKAQQDMQIYNDNIYQVVMLADSTGDISGGGVPVANGFFAINNFADSDAPFPADTTQRAVFALRVKPSSGASFRVNDYTIANIDNNMCGFAWYMMPTFNQSVTWTEIGSTGIEYAKFSGTTTVTSGTLAHSGILTAKESAGLTSAMSAAKFTDGGMVIALTAKSLTNNSDLWYSVTMIN